MDELTGIEAVTFDVRGESGLGETNNYNSNSTDRICIFLY